MKKHRSLSVVIPNFNGEKLLKRNLPSLMTALDNIDLEHEVIISDDFSTDNSIAFLKTNYPSFVIIENKENRGFSPTMNTGIFTAKYDLVLCLNSDVELTPDYFKPQLKYFEDPSTFGVMGRIIGWKDDNVQDGAKYPAVGTLSIKGTVNYLPVKETGKWLPSFFLSGANALIDREKLIAIGGFDEIYAPFYFEDLDMGIKAWRNGWACYYEHDAICRHPASTTISAYHKKKKIKTVAVRNKLLMHAIHLEGLRLILWWIWLIPYLLVNLITFNKVKLKALKLFLNNIDLIGKSRKKVRAAGNPRELVRLSKVCDDIKVRLDNLEVRKF